MSGTTEFHTSTILRAASATSAPRTNLIHNLDFFATSHRATSRFFSSGHPPGQRAQRQTAR
eukprot:2721206-Rhodomonas_salina.1